MPVVALPPPVVIETPPAIYQHSRPGPVLWVTGTQADTQWRCERHGTPHDRGDGRVYGCTVFLSDEPDVAQRTCVVYLATDQHPRTVLDVKVHELAHCNGWRHPDTLAEERGLRRTPKS